MLDDTEIDEAISHAAHKAWRAATAFDPRRGSLRAWFYVIARTRALRLLERKRGRGDLHYVADLDHTPTAVALEDPPPDPHRQKFFADLYRCIDRLSPQQRAVVLADLAAGGTAPADDLAEELNTTKNSIYVARNAARKVLRTSLIRLGHAFPDGPPGVNQEVQA